MKSRSARYYKTGSTVKGKSNPKAAKAARAKKAATDKKINARPEQKAKRRELARERRKRGIMGKGGKDLSHTKNGLRLKSVKANRGSRSDSSGDKRARG